MSDHLGWPDAIAAAVLLLPCVLWIAYAIFQWRKALERKSR